MVVNIINSGSNGNCAVIDDTLIIDAGWNCTPNGKYVLLTHHHHDHVKHLDKMGGLPVYCTQTTADALREKFPYVAFNVCVENDNFYVGDYSVHLSPLKHDASCIAFDILNTKTEKRIYWASDFSEIINVEHFIIFLRSKAFDAIYIECNNTLSPADFADVYFYDEKPPRDEFHRRRSFHNHCNADYLISLFQRAGYSTQNRCETPVTLLHKSSYYYLQNVERIAELAKICNVINPLY